MSRTCEKCIHYEVCRYPLEWRAFPDTCWKYEEDRPHGEWTRSELGYVCSACGNIVPHCFMPTISVLNKDAQYNFCPNCGADMRKEGDEK